MARAKRPPLEDRYYAQFARFVAEHASSKTADEIARIWNAEWALEINPPLVNKSQVYYQLKKLNLIPGAEGRKRICGYRAKEIIRRGKIASTVRNSHKDRILITRQEFLAKRETYRVLHPDQEEKSCPHCKESFPLDKEFFAEYTKNARRYFDTAQCRECRKELRRRNHLAKTTGSNCCPSPQSPRDRVSEQEQKLDRLQAELLLANPEHELRICVWCTKPRPLCNTFFVKTKEKYAFSCRICVARRKQTRRRNKRQQGAKLDPGRRRRQTQKRIREQQTEHGPPSEGRAE